MLNDERALLTIKHDQETFLRRVPRVPVEELKLEPKFKEELIDWQFEAGLNGTKIQKLYAIPYNLNNEAVVESKVKFIDKDKEEEAFPQHPFSELGVPLEEGDRILAVDGIPVKHSFEILSHVTAAAHQYCGGTRSKSLHLYLLGKRLTVYFNSSTNGTICMS